jgi:hypothetical protein
MGKMFDNTHEQMNNLWWDNQHAFGDVQDCSNPQTTSWWKVNPTRELFSWHGSNDFMAHIEPPTCWQYMPHGFLVCRPMNPNDIFHYFIDDMNWADPRAPMG